MRKNKKRSEQLGYLSISEGFLSNNIECSIKNVFSGFNYPLIQLVLSVLATRIPFDSVPARLATGNFTCSYDPIQVFVVILVMLIA
jgi:hypothetical protein